MWEERARSPTSTETQPLPSADQIVASYSRREVADHPFFVRLRERPADLKPIWLLMANVRAGVSRDFVSWLAWTVARVEDRRIGALVAKQLSDELGHGDFERIHSVLLDRFIEGLEPFCASQIREDVLLAPGQTLRQEAAKPFFGEPYEGVGALMVGEIFAEKMDRCVGDAIRRHGGVESHTLTWLMLHETLEVSHAADSTRLAALVPRQGPELAATWRGATDQWRALWQFLDDVDARSASL
jgi:pyrroloquinoline quinone (PQQ) biosynthesis protein C